MGAIAATVSAACAATGLTRLAARVDAACDRAIQTHATDALEALIDEAVAALAAEEPAPPPPAAATETAPARDAPEPSKAPLSIKVDQEQVDTLMKLVGELIVAKNALPYLVKRAEQEYGDRRMARELKAKYDALHRIVDEMQNSVMRIRLVPVGQVFQRFHRVVRDLGRRLDKRIQFDLEGEDVRADKNIVEELAEPLVHLIRNACDHGLEGPAERLAAGKPEKGTIVLSARQVEDRIVIELRDDGRGVNIPKVKRKAVELGILTPAAAEAMSDHEAARLILHPGFSTAEQISDLSGRGVGMDVVHTMVKRTGGALDVRTAPGEGTTVSIALPLSMAVSQVMMFDVDEGLYGVPLEQIVETVRAPARAIHRLQRHEQIVLRGRLIPLLRLRDAFAAPRLEERPEDDLSVLVVRGVEGEVGLVVDNVRSEADVMIEPLDAALNAEGVFSGSALLGDGSIMLMVNVRELV
jgi:two-component system chemotaxis sensor kinase CheA